MGRGCKHHGGSRLASDQIPGQDQNNNCLRPCLSLWYHHQAYRDDTRELLYSLAPSNASEYGIRRIENEGGKYFKLEHYPQSHGVPCVLPIRKPCGSPALLQGIRVGQVREELSCGAGYAVAGQASHS
jgi:hypothetical protein